ncbi:hypothetical protein B0H17DRAFT_1211841 [Mycena rosella]|uniref:Uncharacterized protein n=1 Tax=Mycena rosella TaxID=1033263 RepID=A0AAD7CTQ6_MYCRO|nr:hypothetical protein B0H17DRAFT_1211841 [Mycena rosella]
MERWWWWREETVLMVADTELDKLVSGLSEIIYVSHLLAFPSIVSIDPPFFVFHFITLVHNQCTSRVCLPNTFILKAPNDMAPASEIAADLIKQIPALTTSMRKYDEQNFQLQLRYDNLEEEIVRVRRSIAHKQSQQVRFVEQLAYKDMAKGNLKRQRTEDEPETRMSRPRLEGPNGRLSQRYDFKPSESEMSIDTKRKGRVFSDEETGQSREMDF